LDTAPVQEQVTLSNSEVSKVELAVVDSDPKDKHEDDLVKRKRARGRLTRRKHRRGLGGYHGDDVRPEDLFLGYTDWVVQFAFVLTFWFFMCRMMAIIMEREEEKEEEMMMMM
jgi:hypothetical protein